MAAIDTKDLKEQLPADLRSMIADYAIDASYMDTAVYNAYFADYFENLQWLHARYPAMRYQQDTAPSEANWPRFGFAQAKLLVDCCASMAFVPFHWNVWLDDRRRPVSGQLIDDAFWIIWNPQTINGRYLNGSSFPYKGGGGYNRLHIDEDDTHLRKKAVNTELRAKVKLLN